MSTNLSILEQNVCHGLQCVDGADDLFLRLLPSVGLIEAERAANRWLLVGGFLDDARPAMERGHPGNPNAISEVREFIRERLFRMHKPGN